MLESNGYFKRISPKRPLTAKPAKSVTPNANSFMNFRGPTIKSMLYYVDELVVMRWLMAGGGHGVGMEALEGMMLERKKMLGERG